MARVLHVDPLSPDPTVIAEASRVLRDGGIVALPTETVYGLGVDAFNERAVARLFAAKGRPANRPLIAHVVDEAQARALSTSWPEHAALLAGAFWPGPLTLVVERAPHVPAVVAGGGSSIAVRAPRHAVARAVIEALGHPVAAPSANRFQGVSATMAAHVMKDLADAVDLILDAGQCDAGIESTVVDARGDIARVLRFGALSLAALRVHAPAIEGQPESRNSDQPRDAPGMDRRHYSPRAQLVLAATLRDALRIARERAAEGGRVGLVTHVMPEPEAGLQGLLVRALPSDPVQYARQLYATLHELDDAAVCLIVVHEVPGDERWCAVADRLRRGASP